VNPKIRNLANQIRSGKDSGEKLVLMLGAGASLKSGIKPTTLIMSELLAQYGGGIVGPDLRHQFNQLWAQWDEKQKNQYLMPYLNATPSPGYAPLATLIRKGYIDTIITFNFDRLLQRALVSAGLREDEDFKVIVRGDYVDDRLIALMEMPEPRIKILKLHGSLTGATFLWSEREMLNYPASIEKLVATLTARPIVICGYGFQDVCVVRAFSLEGGAIHCVSPDGIPSGLRGFMINRRSESLLIDGPDGAFDSFFAQLAESLDAPPGPGGPSPQKNPFKYLESYDGEDAEWFLGRDNEARELTRKVQERTKPVICLIGSPKSGKTSLVRAGMMARLDKKGDLAVYLRCRGSIEQTLSAQLLKLLPDEKPGETCVSMLQKLAGTTKQHVVVILDQFERVLTQQPRSGVGREGLRCLRQLAEASCPNLTVVCVSTDLGDLALALLQNAAQIAAQIDFMTLPEMEPAQVSDVIRGLAARAGVEVAPEIVEKIQDEYVRGLDSEQRFSLALVQAICHVLCEQGPADLELYRRLIRDERAALELAINRYDIINFIEDVPNVDERCLLRDIIRLVSHPECNQKIVNYVRQHVSGKWAPPAGFRQD
jgi:hypothetical protein